MNGFVVNDPLVPAALIMAGGPPRDGIPSIDHPRFISPHEAEFLRVDDRVIGVTHNGRARAYPIKILNRHEIVNDVFGDEAVVVSFCPLCGSGVVFSGDFDDGSYEFGVSGLLYNSDVLLYDRHSESLWSQIMLRAINGPMKGHSLRQIPSRNTTWEEWLEDHPDTEVMSTNSGFQFIDYEDDPYAEYKNSRRVWFPLSNTDDRLNNKEWVLGVWTADASKAYPFSALARQASPLEDRIGSELVRIVFDENHRAAVALGDRGNPLQSIQLYWFAWAAFHPDTEVYFGERQ